MTTEDALIAAVIAAPDDDLPRLVYADWLEENGRLEYADFIRCQCRINRMINWDIEGGHECGTRMNMLTESITSWRWQLGIGDCEINYGWSEYVRGKKVVGLRRGMVEVVSCDLSDWISGLGVIVATRHPVKRVNTDKHPSGNPFRTETAIRFGRRKNFSGQTNLPPIIWDMMKCKNDPVRKVFDSFTQADSAYQDALLEWARKHLAK